MQDSIRKFLEKFAKHCPHCDSTQITTLNNEWPLKHRCLDCCKEFTENKKEQP